MMRRTAWSWTHAVEIRPDWRSILMKGGFDPDGDYFDVSGDVCKWVINVPYGFLLGRKWQTTFQHDRDEMVHVRHGVVAATVR